MAPGSEDHQKKQTSSDWEAILLDMSSNRNLLGLWRVAYVLRSDRKRLHLLTDCCFNDVAD